MNPGGIQQGALETARQPADNDVHGLHTVALTGCIVVMLLPR